MRAGPKIGTEGTGGVRFKARGYRKWGQVRARLDGSIYITWRTTLL